ncbi:WD domain, G-beta repeat-containing protein, putative [Eimeria praecox]|uniref:WD domain, G-beta repeat-containing protein, putative n=1 Tax=Eimeria praecox TaxID=51316 RepID=U6H5U7_9EIME|nr:WD domain, G-beta repeat-containing protein, putative [Eimeria praecox]
MSVHASPLMELGTWLHACVDALVDLPFAVLISVRCSCGDLQAAHWQLREIAWGVGTAFASLFERGEFPGSVFGGGDFSVFPAAPEASAAAFGYNDRQMNSNSNSSYQNQQQQQCLQGFANSQTPSSSRNITAREDLWNWKLDRQAIPPLHIRRLAELYGASNVRRFTLAKASWTFAAISNLSAPHLEQEEVSRRLESLEQVGSSLTALLHEMIQDADPDTQTDASGNSKRVASPSQGLQESGPARHANRNKTPQERIALHNVLEALRSQLQQMQWTKEFPTQDVYFSLMLLSQVQEALGQIDIACSTAEAAAVTATTVSDLQEGFCLQPTVLNGIRAWQRVARLLLSQRQLTAATQLTTRLLQLSSGRQPAALSRGKLKLNVAAEGGNEGATREEESQAADSLDRDELSCLPVPPSAPGMPANLVPVEGAICAPAAVVELLVLLADVLIATGQPTKALCLCKWARYYAKEAHLQRGAAFSDASLLASHILAECPALLKVAQTEDSKVISCWETDPLDGISTSVDSEIDANALWGLIANLRRDALLQQNAETQQRIRSSTSTTNSSSNNDSNSAPFKGDASLRIHCVQEASAADPVTADDSGEEINKQKRPQRLTAVDLWRPAALPTLHHLYREERTSEAPAAKEESLNLYDPRNRRKASLLLQLAEAVQHQPGQTAAYFNLVQLAGGQLQRLGEPNPPLCARVWLHQLHAFRLQLELHLQQRQLLLLQRQEQQLQLGSAGEPVEAAESRKEEDQLAALDGLMTEQLLRYFKTVVQIAAFVDTYCGSDLYIHRELFSEALLLSVLMLSISKQLPAQSAAASASGRGGESEESMLKRASFRGAQLCMLALCHIERQRQRTAYQMNNTELETTLQSARCPKPLIRLFAALGHSYNSGKSGNETSVDESFSCGAALNVLQEATRRCGSRIGVLSQGRRIANCLHFVLVNLFSTQTAIGLSPILAADSFAGALGQILQEGEEGRRSLPLAEVNSSLGVNGKKEAQREAARVQQQPYEAPDAQATTGASAAGEATSASVVSNEILLECLRLPQLLLSINSNGSNSVSAQMLWLPPGAASEESLELIRRALAVSTSLSGGIQEEGLSPFSRATVTSVTSRGQFSLALGSAKHDSRPQGKGHQQTSPRDQAVLVAIFAGPEVGASSVAAEASNPTLANLNGSNNNNTSNGAGIGIAVCLKTCSRQRIQALAGACHSVAVEWRREMKALQSVGGNNSYLSAVKAEDESLESRTVDIFARIFVLFSEGKRLCAEAGEIVNAFEPDIVENSPTGATAAGKTADTPKRAADGSTQQHQPQQQQQQQQDSSGSKQEGKLSASTTSGVAPDRIRLHVATTRQGDLPKGSAAASAAADHNNALTSSAAPNADHSSKASGILLSKRRTRARKSIADFLAETSGIQKTSLEAERSESYSAAARLLVELKKEMRISEENNNNNNTEVEGCGPTRGGRSGQLKHLPAIKPVACLELPPKENSGFNEPPCLQHIVRSPTLSKDICCIDASSTIYMVDAQQLRCTYTVENAHCAPVTSSSFLHHNSHVLVTTSQDGAVKLWDLRSPHSRNQEGNQATADAAVQVAPPGSREADMWALAVRGDDLVFAVSFKNSIKGYDLRAVCSQTSSRSPSTASPASNEQQERRAGKQKRSKRLLWDIQVHGDSVTALQFHPVYPQLLFSGGEDSLVCLSDTSTARKAGGGGQGNGDEDGESSLVYCFSQDRAVKGLSLVGPDAACICVRSSMEDVGLWQLDGLERFRNNNNTATAAGMSGSSTSTAEVYGHRRAEWLAIRSHPAIKEGDSCGYVVDTFYDSVVGRLFVLAGSVSGQLLLLHANLDGVTPAAVFRSRSSSSSGAVAASVSQGHSGVVRGAIATPGSENSGFGLITCGEDGRICSWSQASSRCGVESSSNNSSSSRNHHARPY